MFEDVAAGVVKLTWRKVDLADTLARGEEAVRDAVYAVLEQQAPGVEAHMKQNAPWQDQSGAARAGLRAEAYDQGDSMGIILYHQVPYGIWLEVKDSGRYAIIVPTIEIKGPEVMQALEGTMGKLRF